MIDFTSALYLGLTHSSRDVGPWTGLTLGKPAALEASPGAEKLARQIALLQGLEAGTLGPSTLHLFWDLFDMIGRDKHPVFFDSGAYPVARWGGDRAAILGAAVCVFPHHSPRALQRAIEQHAPRTLKPAVVCDGFCPDCGRPAPLREYLQVARRHGGRLIIDDTQALGVLGSRPSMASPLGFGGGGSFRHAGLSGPDLASVSSLAKGLGSPVAALCGSRDFVRSFEERSQTRVHCSPPSAPVIAAAARAMEINRIHGDALRRRLASLVDRFQAGLRGLAAVWSGVPFPAQRIEPVREVDPGRAHRRLERRGIRTLLARSRHDGMPGIALILNSRHQFGEIDAAVMCLRDELASASARLAPIEGRHV